MDFYTYTRKYAEMVEHEMQKTLASESGETYGMLWPFLGRGGKRVRPILTVLSCMAVGGNTDAVVRPAALIELFHNFTLIHDDIEDGSKFRRGEPTLHLSYGVSIALNSGDALYTLVWKGLVELELPPEKLITVCKMCGAGFKAVVDGQGTELSWYHSHRYDISESEYLGMINGKTAALMGLSCELGAYLGGADSKTIEKLKNFGKKIGIAFQIHDDILNVTGTFEKYKKEIGGDISEGKRTLMVIHSLKKAGKEERDFMLRILEAHSTKHEDIAKVINIIKKYGSVDYAVGIARQMVEEAKADLSWLKESEEKKALLSLCEFSVGREC